MKKAAKKQGLSLIGKYVVVRGTGSGVVAGVLTAEDAQTITMTEARQCWSWAGVKPPASYAELALFGPGGGSRISTAMPIYRIERSHVVSITAASPEAERLLRGIVAA
jgi:hypothetical protein